MAPRLPCPGLALLLGALGAAAADGGRRLDEASRCAGQDKQPLLWRSVTGNGTVYILASYPVPQEAMLPFQSQVQNALACADVAFFELACAPRDMGNYLSHCFHYSAIEENDNLKARIPAPDFQALSAAVEKLVQTAPPECANLAANLSRAKEALGTSRQTLRAFYAQALRTLHPSACKRKEGALMYQESIRGAFGPNRPVFGLRDVATECAIYRGGSEQEDAQLARKMIRDFGNDEWRANMTRNQEAMEDILRCGDLGRLRNMPGVGDLPGLGERVLGSRNPMLAEGALQAIQRYPGKVLLLVLGITHLLDFGTVKSVKTILQETGGLAFQRITAGTDLSCTASSYSAMGAKEQGTCLLPPGRSQPASCDAFTEAFKKAEATAAARFPAPNASKGQETLGRIKRKGDCVRCVKSNDPCECDIAWENDTGYAELCNRTMVEGARGQVVYMDLTRNPGSVHPGAGLAEKTVRGLYQSCIATSCDIGFRQDIALRHWYQQDPQLAGGVVTLRFPGQKAVVEAEPAKRGGIAAWPWWAWLLFLGLLACCVGALMRAFLTPKKKKVMRAQMPLNSMEGSHFQKVDTQGPPRTEDLQLPPYDPRQQQPPQQGWEQTQGMAGPSGGYGYGGGPPTNYGTGGPPLGPPTGTGLGPLGYDGLGGTGAGVPLRGEEGWPFPSPQGGARAFELPELDTAYKGPTWQPQLDWPPQLEQPNPFQGFDNNILNQAMQMQQQLGDAGAQAVQRMQQQAMENWRRQNQLTAAGGPGPLQNAGSVSLPPPLGAGFGSLPGQPPLSAGPGFQANTLQLPLSGRGQPGQPPLSAPTYQPGPPQSLGASGGSGALFPSRGTSQQLFAPPSPSGGLRAASGTFPPGSPAPGGLPYGYGRIA